MRRLSLALFLLAVPLFAQNRLELSIDTIMRGPALYGHAPRAVRWSRDGKLVYFEWKERTDPVEERFGTWVVGRDGKGLRKLSEDEAKHAPPRNASWTRDRKRAVFSEDGDLFLFDALAGKRRALTQTTETESDARFTHDEKRVAFVRRNNLFVADLASGEVAQRTNIVAADEKGPHVSLFEDPDKDKTPSQKWVGEEAMKLSDVLTRRTAQRKKNEAERKAELAIAPMKLKKGESIADLQLTPDEKYVVVFVSVDAADGKQTGVPSYVTDSGYTKELSARKKVGDAQDASRVAVVSTVDGKVQWLKTGLKRPASAKTEAETKSETKTESATGEKTEATAEKTEAKEPPERDVEFDTLRWSDDGAAAFLSVRAADNKDWWLLALDPATATTRVLAHDHDDAWITWETDSGFVPRSRTVWFKSERTGWLHLYTVPFDGGEPRAVTSGSFEVADIQFADDHKAFYLTASRDSLFERHLYRVAVDGALRESATAEAAIATQRPAAAQKPAAAQRPAAAQKLTTTPGWHDAVVAPDGIAVADVYSDSNHPWELYVGRTRVTSSPAPEFSSYPWIDPPIVKFTARDGAEVPAHLYKPANWNGGPAVIFVHGAGYLQNVQRAWSYYAREYLFHHLLMERGVLVLDIDYRASQGYGRDWRTAIYRHMGGKDLDDHLDAAKWLVRELGVDAKRIGIYGGSYGGFITLMAMFKAPGVFAAGAALRPVTDWAHYNHGYTSNILNTPQSDPEAYRRSSPIYFAEGLEGALLICHGMIDVNVHYQDTVRLAQRLIELRKEDWEVAGYPLEDHSFIEETSWADEYKRILRLFERKLK